MNMPFRILSFALMMTAAPAAFAQSGPGAPEGQQPAGDYGRRGDSLSVDQFQLRPEVEQDVRQRMGPEQRPLELVQTTLLNRFGGLGFHRIVDIDKQGTNYLAMVETVRGNNVVLMIDPQTGQILSERPATAAETAAASTTTGATGTMGATGATGGAMPQAPGAGASQPTAVMPVTPGMPEGGDVLAAPGCNPAQWAPLEQRIGALTQDRELAARRLLMEILDHHADNENVLCRDKIEDLRSLVQTAGVR